MSATGSTWRRWFGGEGVEVAEGLYAELVARGRAAIFFTAWEVPDTLDGRFETICLHVGLVLRRLQREGGAGRALSQDITDAMIADMDRNLRELGVGDLGVGKRVRAMAEAMLGRTHAYDRALAADASASALGEALKRNLFGTNQAVSPLALAACERYVREFDAALAAMPGAELIAGRLPEAPAVARSAG
jgi:cytochrome b pre-mRNA-processing protein 3